MKQFSLGCARLLPIHLPDPARTEIVPRSAGKCKIAGGKSFIQGPDMEAASISVRLSTTNTSSTRPT